MPDQFEELPLSPREAEGFAAARDIIDAELRRRMDAEFNRRIGYYRYLAWGALFSSIICTIAIVVCVVFIQVERRNAAERSCDRTQVITSVLIANLEKVPSGARKPGSFTFNILKDLRGIKC